MSQTDVWVADAARMRRFLEDAGGYTECRRVELHNLESGGGASVVLNPLQARRAVSSRLSR